MADGRLVIGTQRYSSWSLRGWLMVKLAQLNVDIDVVPLAGGGKTTVLKTLSPNGCVPWSYKADKSVECLPPMMAVSS